MKTIFTSIILALSVHTVNAQGALNFPDANDYGTVPSSELLHVFNTFTIESWVKFSGSGYQTVCATDDVTGTGHTGYWYGLTPSGTAGIQLFDGTFSWTTITGTTNLNDGTWHHIAATSDGTTIRIVVDGVEEGSGVYYDPMYDGNDLDVGVDQEGNYVTGAIDELRIWVNSRSAADIALWKDSCLTDLSDSLVAYYKFDETSGSTFEDATIYGHDGTLTNMTDADWVDGAVCVDAGPSGIKDEELEDVTVLYNEIQNQISVNLNGNSDATITLYALNGAILYQGQNVSDLIYNFDLNTTSGMYIVTVESQGKKGHFKVLKTQ